MKGDAIDNGNEEERPMGTTFGSRNRALVIDGKENVRNALEIWKSILDIQESDGVEAGVSTGEAAGDKP